MFAPTKIEKNIILQYATDQSYFAIAGSTLYWQLISKHYYLNMLQVISKILSNATKKSYNNDEALQKSTEERQYQSEQDQSRDMLHRPSLHVQTLNGIHQLHKINIQLHLLWFMNVY